MKFSSDIFNGYPNKFVVKLDFIEIDDNLNNFENHSLSVNYVIDEGIDDMLFSMLINEINQNIYKSITKKLFDSVKFDHINLGSNALSVHDSQRLIVKKILENKDNYSTLISSAQICTGLSDSSLFSISSIGANLNHHGIIYSTGKLSDINVYCDPFMRYDDGRICLFDKVKVNVKNFELSYVPSTTFTGVTKIKYDLSIDIGDSMVIFVLGEGYNGHEFKRLQRDLKINKILDGEKN
jgi:hypothetical protein